LRAAYAEADIEAEVLDFIDDMPRRYAEADLVICRAGAITVSELTAAGVASVLVPFVASTTSHQRDNAQWMAEKRAALHLPQAELNPQKVALLLQSLTREKCGAMAEAARAIGRRDANAAIAQVLEELGGKP
jgi:UDP-N-acetylglucosamine--N-acetylmuramyl-(pentapeptide) pyrophosphoryl-undecaprenol N-acetylglucosamine transferase